MTNGEYSTLEKRWLESILEANELRLAVRRAKVVARKGWVRNIKVRPGLITAQVTSDTGASCDVSVRMEPIDEIWDAVLERLANEAALAADLLGGRVTDRLAFVFEEEGHDLFPFDLRDVKNFCSGHPDDPNCIDAIAVHFDFAKLITAHPMTLFEFRGRSQAELIEAMRELRQTDTVEATVAVEPSTTSVEDGTALLDGYWERGVVPHLAFRVERTHLSETDALPVVRALGPGPGETPPEDVVRVLAPLMRTARRRMDAIHDRAESDAVEMQEAPDPIAAESLDDLLVAAAHQHGSLTSGFVAKALGIDPREARQYLKWLVDEGRLAVVGRARGTKYLPIGADLPAESAEEG
ncbi:MAG: hypothetical protein EP329_17650 [Deltaproteobacteria bacterium]|nr:MAG: hypothetical protein EP329_17650 [Deltaproteobacteria bacterium]